MIKLDLNLHLLLMINKKNFTFFSILILLTSCSFDSKTGIWGDAEKEKKKIALLEQEQKQIISTENIYSSENIFAEEIPLKRAIKLSEPKKNKSWDASGLNNQNFIGNIYLPRINSVFLKKKNW